MTTPTLAEQQIINFYVNGVDGLGNFATGNSSSYTGKAFDTNNPTGGGDPIDVNTLPGGFASTSSAPGAISEASASLAVGTAGGAITGATAEDAFDGYGAIGLQGMTQFGGLTVTRDTEVTHGPGGAATYLTTPFQNAGIPNAARWMDTFVNNTGTTISGVLATANNMGSDSSTVFVQPGSGNRYVVSYQNGSGNSDPVLVHVFGNNDYTANHVTLDYTDGDDNPIWKFDLSVAPGDTKRIAFFVLPVASTAYDTSDHSPEVALGVQFAEQMTSGPLPINTPFFVGYTADELLQLLNWDFVAAGLTPETQASLSAIGNAVPTQVALGIFNELSNLRLNGDTSSSGYASLDGGLLAGASRSQAGRGIVALTGQRSGVSAGDDTRNSWAANGWRAFAIASGFTGSQDGQGVSSGVDYSGFSATLGVDRLISDKTRLGSALSYANVSGDVASSLGNSDVDAYAMSVYATHNFTPYFYMDGVAMLGWNNYNYNRVQGPSIAHGNTDGMTWGVNLRTGFDVPVAENTKMGPYLSLSYSDATVDGYTETGAGIGNLTVAKSHNRSGAVEGGMKASHRIVTGWGSIVPEAKLGVRGSLGSEDTSVTAQYVGTPASSTSTTFRNNPGTAITTGLGAAANVSERLELKLSYDGTYGHNTENNALTLRALISF